MDFEYHQPSTMDEVFELLARLPEAKIVAGGTDLMVQMRRSRRWPPALISLRRVRELAFIEDGPRLRIGATVPVREVATHPVVAAGFPALAESIRVFGSPQIRNVATLGGNLCNASPAADCAPPLLIYEAKVELGHSGGRRELPLESFVLGPGTTALRPGEVLTAIVLDPPSRGSRSTFLRKGRVHMDLAIASIAALVEIDGSTCVSARIAAGAVAPVPRRLARAEAVIGGSDVGAKARTLAGMEARREVSPISDLRASKEYRRRLTGVFVERALAQLAPEGIAGGDEQ